MKTSNTQDLLKLWLTDRRRSLRLAATKAENAYRKPSAWRDAALTLAAAHREAADVYDRVLREHQAKSGDGL